MRLWSFHPIKRSRPPRNLLHSEFQESGVLAIGIDNVSDGSFSLGRKHRISIKKYRELEKYTARPLDVLVTVMATVGRCCVIPSDTEKAIITKHVYRMTVEQKLMNPYFLMFAFRGDPSVQQQVQDQTRGQTRPGINGQILKSLIVPVPPIAEQREIVRRVEALLKLADAIEKRVAAAMLRTEKLTQAIPPRHSEENWCQQKPSLRNTKGASTSQRG